MFSLHPTLEQDCIVLGSFNLSLLLLMNDSRYPWLILVPQKNHIQEIHQLSEPDQIQLIKESSCISHTLQQVTEADKLNIGALGNLVPQLHLHHIARFKHDACWPKPVWGQAPAIPYSPESLGHFKQALLTGLKSNSNHLPFSASQ